MAGGGGSSERTMFWVDEVIEKIIKTNDQDKYLITDWKTPSGHIHVGALRGVMIHDIITQALKRKNKKATFQYGFDDFDPMDSLPAYVDKSFGKYLGVPLCNIPASDKKSKSFAEQYLSEFQKVFNGLGIEPKIVRNSEIYKEGKYNPAIKIILDHPQDIRKIYKEVSGSDKGEDWYPLQVVCPNCGKLGTTKVVNWDGKEVGFRCEEKLVQWAKGCGYQGKISPYDGKAKIPWKVEWAAKWFVFGSDIEGEGKDHSAAGGSRDVANHIYRKVFDKTPPFDIPYEFFLVSGAKMSSSKGVGVSAKDMANLLPKNILRFLLLRTRPKRTIDFAPEGDTIPLVYDEYDRMAELYQKDPKADLAQSYFYTQLELAKGQPEYLLRFAKIAYMFQMPRADILEYAKEEKGDELTAIEKKEIENRIEIAKKWLAKFAPENYKFTISETLPGSVKNLSPQQKEFLRRIGDLIESKEKWTGEDLHQEIHKIKKEMDIDAREAFGSIYQVFIGKDSGPQAGWLLASLDREFVIKRLKAIA
jgi:lysyl-tRNA synthetase class 1